MQTASIIKRRSQTYSAAFKAQLVAACSQPGVSMAAVALANQLNANVLRRWVKEHESRLLSMSDSTQAVAIRKSPAVVPVALRVGEPLVAGDIRCEIRRQGRSALAGATAVAPRHP